jgi:outer membrane protein TolC
LLLAVTSTYAQYSLEYYSAKAVENSPALKESQSLQAVNQLQQKLNRAENSAFHASLSGNYLFTPYFNNSGHLVTTDPSPQAVGYDINMFDGGLYSAQLNLERNILNGGLMRALDHQIQLQDKNLLYSLELEKHTLQKQVADQYLNTLQFLLTTRLSKEVAENLQKQLDLTSDLVSKGYAKVQDYLLLKIELKNQEIALNDALQQYRSSLLQLNALCGIQDTTVIEIDSVALDMDALLPQSRFVEKYLLDSLTTANQQKLFETKYLPQVNLFFNTGLNAVELQNIQRKFGMSAGLALSLPLFDGRQKHLTRQQNLILLNTIGEYRQFSQQNLAMQRSDMAARAEALRKTIAALAEQVNDYQELIRLSENQLRQGNLSMLDHLILLRNFADIRRDKIDAEIKYQLEINNYNYWNW